MTTLIKLILTAQSRRINVCLLCVVLLFLPLGVSAQWAGAGTEQNPYQIYTIQDLEDINTNETAYNSYQNIHFELMNNITDTLRDKLSDKFYGYFHGKGYYITLGINNTNPPSLGVYSYGILIDEVYGTIDSLTLFGKVTNINSLFQVIRTSGKLLDIVCNMVIEPYKMTNGNFYCAIFTHVNDGIIKNCINNSDLQNEYSGNVMFSVFTFTNIGQIINCVNNGNITISTDPQSFVWSGVFCEDNSCSAYEPTRCGSLTNCINNGNINIIGVPNYSIIFIFTSTNMMGCTVSNCINTGNINAKKTDSAGVFASFNYGNIKKCLNIGNLTGDVVSGGIVGSCSNSYIFQNLNNSIIENCLNTGYIFGNSETGGIIGNFDLASNTTQAIVKNNLDISKTSLYGLFGDTVQNIYQDPLLILENNFYDKQMVTIPATQSGDIAGKAEGKLTTEMTGFALQNILGNGWSYAEGRYPIPLGLENHPAALLAATPVYLHADNSENYDTVDSVSKNFTVSLENNVQWQVLYNNVLLQGNNVLLQNTGYENLIVSLENYKKNIPINVRSIQNSIPITEFNEIFIYPNPVKDELKIMNYELRIMNVEILDITGKKILIPHSSLLDTHYLILDTNSLPQGIYFLKIYADKGNKIGKFIKN